MNRFIEETSLSSNMSDDDVYNGSESSNDNEEKDDQN